MPDLNKGKGSQGNRAHDNGKVIPGSIQRICCLLGLFPGAYSDVSIDLGTTSEYSDIEDASLFGNL